MTRAGIKDSAIRAGVSKVNGVSAMRDNACNIIKMYLSSGGHMLANFAIVHSVSQ